MKILMTFHSPILDAGEYQPYSFHESIMSSFSALGHDVEYMITNDFLVESFAGKSNQTQITINDSKLKEYIAAQNYGLVVTLNHALPHYIKDTVQCPILILDADTIVTFNDLNELKENTSRYHFGCFSTHGLQSARATFGANAKIFHARYGTQMRARAQEPEHNISFVGTFFHANKNILSAYLKNSAFIKKVLNDYQNAYEKDEPYDLEQAAFDAGVPYESLGFTTCTGLRGFNSGAKRNQVLAALAPLGLHLRGDENWVQIAHLSTQALKSFEPQKIYTLKDLNALYNASKISLNTSHDQIKTGYSWRVLDVLASNACLLSDPSADLQKHFPKGVLQIYDDPKSAYEKAKYLIENEKERNDIVQEANKIIEQKFRWSTLIPEWLVHIGLSEEKQSENQGKVTRIKRENFMVAAQIYKIFVKKPDSAVKKVKKFRVSKKRRIVLICKKKFPRLVSLIKDVRARRKSM